MAEMKPVIPGIEDYNEARLDAAEARAQVAALEVEAETLRAQKESLEHKAARLGIVTLCATCGGTGELPGGMPEYPAGACCPIGHAKGCECLICHWRRHGYKMESRVAALTAERDALMRITAEKINAGIERRAQDFMLKEPNRLITQDGRIAALEAELAAAKQDTARLDFWMREVNEMYTSPRYDGAMGTDPSDERPMDREYLDAAMLAARAPEGTEWKDKDGEA